MNPLSHEMSIAVTGLLFRTAMSSTVLLAAAWLAARCLRRASAATRYGVWLIAVLGSLASPLAAVGLPSMLPPMTAMSPRSPAADMIATSDAATSASPGSEGFVPGECQSPAGSFALDADAEWLPDAHRDGDVVVDRSPGELGSADPVDDLASGSPEGLPSASAGGSANGSVDALDAEGPTSAAAPALDSGSDAATGAVRILHVAEALLKRFTTSGGPAIVAAAWLLVSTWMLGRLTSSIVAVRRMLARSEPADAEPSTALLTITRTRLAVVTSVELRLSDEATIPLVVGIRRPALVLPREAETWTQEKLQAAMLHELAQVRRRDVLWQMIASLATATLWFQPLLWLASRRMRAERELACDDIVLESGASPCDYAEQLLDFASRACSPRLGSPLVVAMATRPMVENRIRSILDPLVRRLPLSRRRAAAIGVSAALVLTVGTAITPNLSRSATSATQQISVSPDELSRDVETEADKPESEFASQRISNASHTPNESAGAEGGIPWWTILDADGNKLATSNAPDGHNIGYPSEPDGIAHFRKILNKTAIRTTAAQIDELVQALQGEKANADGNP